MALTTVLIPVVANAPKRVRIDVPRPGGSIPGDPIPGGRDAEAAPAGRPAGIGGLIQFHPYVPSGFGSATDHAAPPEAAGSPEAFPSNSGTFRNNHLFVRRLGAFNLGRQGERALSAVLKLHLEPSLWRTPWQYFRRQIWLARLEPRIVNDLGVDFDGDSVTLGLALGAMLVGSNSPSQRIIATGDLDVTDRGGDDQDPPVLPIGSLRTKFALVEAWGEKRRREEQGRETVLFFIPIQELPDEPGRSDSIASWTARFRELGIALVPVATLGEAADRLKARRIRPIAEDHAIRTAGAVLALGIVLAAGWGTRQQVEQQRIAREQAAFEQWRRQPIAGGITFQPLADSQGTTLETPLRYRDNDLGTSRPLCGKDALVAGETLFVNARIGDGTQPDSYWPTVLAIPEYLNAGKFHAAIGAAVEGCAAGPVVSGATWCRSVGTVGGEFENMAVILLADRHADISADLDREMEVVQGMADSANNGAPVKLPLRKVINHFGAVFPGRIASTVVRLVKPEECAP